MLKKMDIKKVITLIILAVLFTLFSAILFVYSLRIADSPTVFPSAPVHIRGHHSNPLASQIAVEKPEPEALKHDYVIPPVVDGIPPVVTNFKTDDPVVFLGIDDGAFKDPSVVKMIKDNNIKASLFLAKSFIANNPNFFKDIVATGSLVENHTLNHDLNMVKDMDFDQQKAEICGMADYEQQIYGRRPIFVRPPGGAYSATFLQAAGACGMRAVVTWIAKANGGSMQYQVGDHLRPGDVVLIHFRPEFAQDMQAFLDAQKAAGLHTELLEDWIN